MFTRSTPGSIGRRTSRLHERGTLERMVTRIERLVYGMVLERDRVMAWERATRSLHEGEYKSLTEYLMDEPWVCVAPLVDSNEWGKCSGEMQRDHVHEHTGGTKSKRAPTTMETVVILCRHHHLNGWATSHRPEIRTYIKEANERYKMGLHPR